MAGARDDLRAAVDIQFAVEVIQIGRDLDVEIVDHEC